MHSKLFQIKCFNVFALVTINHSSPPHMMLSYRPCGSPPPPTPSLLTSPPIILKLQLTIPTIAIIKSIKLPSTIKLENRKFGCIAASAKIQSPTKVLARLHTFPVSVKAIYQATPLPPIQCCSSCLVVFPTYFNPGNSLKILHQISLLSMCTPALT